MFSRNDLVCSLPDPGDCVVPILEKRHLRSREEEVESLRLTVLESGRAGACGDSAAAAVAME